MFFFFQNKEQKFDGNTEGGGSLVPNLGAK